MWPLAPVNRARSSSGAPTISARVGSATLPAGASTSPTYSPGRVTPSSAMPKPKSARDTAATSHQKKNATPMAASTMIATPTTL